MLKTQGRRRLPSARVSALQSLTTKVTARHANQCEPAEDLEKVIRASDEVETVACGVLPRLSWRGTNVTEVEVIDQVGDLCECPKETPAPKPS
jgi:hypothetical protein